MGLRTRLAEFFSGWFPTDEQLYVEGIEYAKKQIAEGYCICELCDTIGFEGASDPFDQGMMYVFRQHQQTEHVP